MQVRNERKVLYWPLPAVASFGLHVMAILCLLSRGATYRSYRFETSDIIRRVRDEKETGEKMIKK